MVVEGTVGGSVGATDEVVVVELVADVVAGVDEVVAARLVLVAATDVLV